MTTIAALFTTHIVGIPLAYMAYTPGGRHTRYAGLKAAVWPIALLLSLLWIKRPEGER